MSQPRTTGYVTRVAIGAVVRWVPGFYWVHLALHWTPIVEPGHGWLYMGCVRRDTATIRRRGLVLVTMPKRGKQAETEEDAA